MDRTSRRYFAPRILLVVATLFALAASELAQPTQILGVETGVVAAATGTNYYVDSVNGSDSGDGLSPSTAWRSLAPVQSRAFAPGDTVNFARGSSWSGGLTIRSSGTAESPITFKAYGTGARPVITNPGVTYGSAIRIEANYVVVEGFLLRDAHEAGVFIARGTHHNVVRDNEITAAGTGVTVVGQYNLITGNYAHDLRLIANTPGGDDDYGAVGVFVYDSNNEISYNRIVNCRASSYDYGYDGGTVELYGEISNVSFHHNYSSGTDGFMEVGGGSARDITVAYNVSNGDHNDFNMIHLSGSFASSVSNFRVENNTIVMGSGYRVLDFGGSAAPSSYIFRNNVVYSGIGVANSSSFSHSNNLYYLYNGATLGFSLGVGEKVGEPGFVDLNGGDFHLRAGSPAIDGGVNLGYGVDFDGKAVPFGSAPDMGAFECDAPPAAPPGPVAFWKLNEGTGTASDGLGGAGAASLHNGPVWTEGRFGKALQFNGSDQYGEVADNDLLSPLATTGEMTVAAWVNLSQLPSSASEQRRAPFLAKGNRENWEYALYVLADGRVGFSVWNLDGTTYGEPMGGSLPLNGWHYLVGTAKSGQFVRVYLDGALVGETTTLAGRPGNGTSPLYLARRGDGQYLNTLLDEVRIYDRVLSPTEIQVLSR